MSIAALVSVSMSLPNIVINTSQPLEGADHEQRDADRVGFRIQLAILAGALREADRRVDDIAVDDRGLHVGCALSRREHGLEVERHARAVMSIVVAQSGGVVKSAAPSGQVLVVDDEVMIGEILHGVLGLAGYDVVSALDGREALQVAADQSFDLVLLDINMSVIDGWTVLAELLQTDADLPVVMVSAFTQQADATDRGARGLSRSRSIARR